MSALFTSVPVDKALVVIQRRLEEDTTLPQRTSLTPVEVIQLLEACVNCTYFIYNGTFFQQIHGAAMGSPVSPILCNLYMEDFENRALTTAPHPAEWWYRYVDDTYTKQKTEHTAEFLSHINSIDPNIQFTTEAEEDGCLAFLDTSTVRQLDGTLKIKVFRKQTHTDQYLLFDSNHPIEHKLGVVRTLHNRANTIVTDPRDKQEEVSHVNEALAACGYPSWAIRKATAEKVTTNKDNRQINTGTVNQKGKKPVVLPYLQGLSEALRRKFATYHIPVYFKPQNTLRQQLVAPKDKSDKGDICGPVYYIKCEGSDHEHCDNVYIGETERTLRARFSEHRRPSTTTSEVSNHIFREHPGHKVDLKNVKVLSRDTRWYERGVRESIHIRTLRPSLNRDGGRHQLSHIWDNLLVNTHQQSVDRD